jgi:hypothetical protein
VGGVATLAVLLMGAYLGWFWEVSESEAIIPTENMQSQIAVRSGKNIGNSGSASEVENCLSESMLETHPAMMDELARLDPYVVNFGSISDYRDLAESELRHLIAQGDSGAMAVLGAMHVMRARGLSDSDAVPYLLLEDPNLFSYQYKLPHTEEQMRHYELAADWFYKSALHGRLLALINVGDQLVALGKTPIDLGWISTEDYDQLTRAQKSTFNAANVYQAVAYTIAPQVEVGFLEEIGQGFGAIIAKRFANIAEPIVTQFRSDRAELGLGPLTIPPSTLPSYSELTELLCNTPE